MREAQGGLSFSSSDYPGATGSAHTHAHTQQRHGNWPCPLGAHILRGNKHKQDMLTRGQSMKPIDDWMAKHRHTPGKDFPAKGPGI